MFQNNNFSFSLFLFFTVIFFCVLFQAPIFKKTTSGEYFETMETLNAKHVPIILAEYLKQNHSQYTLYKIPNYIEELFKYNKDYYPIYKANGKKTILVISYSDSTSNNDIKTFFNKLHSEIKLYHNDYNFINITSEKSYNTESYRAAYEELEKICKYICIIDPVKNTMFTLKKAKDSDTKALEVILQQYSKTFVH